MHVPCDSAPRWWAGLPGVLSFRGLLVVELTQRSIQIQLLLGQQGQLGKIATPLGFGDQDAQIALAALNGPLLNLLDGAQDLALLRRLSLRQQGLGKQSALGWVFD